MATVDGTGKIYLSADDINEIILEAAPHLKGTYFAIGPISGTADGIEIDYAFSDECHPKDWASPPWWFPQKAAK